MPVDDEETSSLTIRLPTALRRSLAESVRALDTNVSWIVRRRLEQESRAEAALKAHANA
jgi:predicted transcriptional regulator